MSSESERPLILGQYAGFVTRMVAWIIDQGIVIATTSLITAVASLVSDALRINEFLGIQEWANALMAILVAVVTLTVWLVYYLGLWMLTGQTVGKWIMGVRIVRTDGGRLRIGNCVRRLVGYLLSAILFLGYLWVLVDDRRQGFHDKLAGTFVVYAWPEREPVRPAMSRIRRRRRERSLSSGA